MKKKDILKTNRAWGSGQAWYVGGATMWVSSGWEPVHIVESNERGDDGEYKKYVVREEDFDRCFTNRVEPEDIRR